MKKLELSREIRAIPTFLFYSTLTIALTQPPAPEKYEIGQSYRSIMGYRSGNQNHRKKYIFFPQATEVVFTAQTSNRLYVS